jgi:hypothetical protein
VNSKAAILAVLPLLALVASCAGKSDTTCNSSGQCITTLAPFGGVGCECWSNSLTVDATSVYWRACSGLAGTINKVSIGGGDATILWAGEAGPCGVAVDSASVYWINDPGDEIMKVPIAGGDPTTLASGDPYFTNLAVDSTSVYWASWNGALDVIMNVPLDGGEATTLASGTPAMGFAGASAIAVDGTNVYWTNPFGGCGGNVMKVPIEGGTPSELATGIGAGAGLVVDATTVYVTTGSDCPGDGSVMAIPIAPRAAAPSRAAASSRGLRWALRAARLFYRVRSHVARRRRPAPPLRLARGERRALAWTMGVCPVRLILPAASAAVLLLGCVQYRRPMMGGDDDESAAPPPRARQGPRPQIVRGDDEAPASTGAATCTSDFQCGGIGVVCIKPAGQLMGQCGRSVNQFGNQEFNLPRMDSMGPGKRSCYSMADCPVGFQCNQGNCVK